MAYLSKLKSVRLKSIEDSLRRVQAIENKVTKEKYKTILVQRQLDDLKL